MSNDDCDDHHPDVLAIEDDTQTPELRSAAIRWRPPEQSSTVLQDVPTPTGEAEAAP